MAKLAPFYIVSPDGIPIQEKPFTSESTAKKVFNKWKARYKEQGYYSSNSGPIDLLDLSDNCYWVPVAEFPQFIEQYF